MSDTELQGAHDHGEGPTEDETDQDEPGRFRRFLAGVGRGLRAIFRPVVIATLAAVVAAGALVIVAVEQREQTDWQRRRTCLAWFQVLVTPLEQEVAPRGASSLALDAAEQCGGIVLRDGIEGVEE